MKTTKYGKKSIGLKAHKSITSFFSNFFAKPKYVFVQAQIPLKGLDTHEEEN